MGTSPSRKARTLRTLVENIPAELRKLPQWACSASDGRPINPHSGRNARSNDPSTWGTIEQAAAACEKYGHSHVAFMLTSSDPYVIVDLDNKADKPADESMLGEFCEIIDGLDSYTERSRSGRGTHIVVKAALEKPVKTPHVEIYAHSHPMTFTGDVHGKPKKIAERSTQIADISDALRPKKRQQSKAIATNEAEEPDDVVVQRASERVPTCERFKALHRGDWEDAGYSSQSEADIAYVGMLWNDSGNVTQVERLWLESPLADRAKGQRPDYIANMLEKVSQSPPKILTDEGPASLFSDTANGHRLQRYYGDSLLFVPGVGWLVWDSARWNPDPLAARHLAGKLGQRVVGEAGAMMQQAAMNPDRDESDKLRDLAGKLFKFAGQVENVNKIDAALKAAEPLLRADADKLDADPWLLGCPNGVADLRTGKLSAPDPALLITKSTGVAFDPKSEAPVWTAFLQRIFRSNPDLAPFVQQLAGYWLTGLTDPPFLSVFYGVGANGKSTLMTALSNAMGEYAMAAPPGLLMKRYGDRHPTELAALQGRRLVVAAESGEGGRLDEERIKSLTGSDPITARMMNKDFYTFDPTHNFVLMTNHKPIVRGTDEGIWRRLVLVHFVDIIPEQERDPSLGEKLRAEAPGILRWAVEGARQFHANDRKFKFPAIVVEATRAYRSESDVLGEFIADECERGPSFDITSALLYQRYTEWCEATGERPMTKRSLATRLQEGGFTQTKDRKGVRGWKGLRIARTIYTKAQR